MGCSCCPCTSGPITTSSSPGRSSTFSPPSTQVFPGRAVITGGTLTVNTTLRGCGEENIWVKVNKYFKF